MRNEKGMTLIEIILSVIIIGIIGIIAAEAFLYSTNSVMTGDAVREATQVNRLAMDRMIREMRNVRNNLCVAQAVVPPPAKTFSFVDGNNKTITYSWSGISGDPLLRTENATTNTIVGKVSSLAFTYYDNSCGPDKICGNADDTAQPVDITALPPTVCASPNTCSTTLCAATNIWQINIDLKVISGGETVELRSQVHPRGF